MRCATQHKQDGDASSLPCRQTDMPGLEQQIFDSKPNMHTMHLAYVDY